jgi:hypothetical protein
MPMLTIDEVAEFSELAKKQLTDLKRENDHMRATLANGPGPCEYCDLTRAEWSKCAMGFPGCARGDDAVLCPHVGAGMDETRLRAALEHIASGELGVNLCVKLAKEALGPNVGVEAPLTAQQEHANGTD